MNDKVNKISTYRLLERVLNDNYDEEFKIRIIAKDLSDYGTEVLGTKHIYFIENKNHERMFKSESLKVAKEKKGNNYVSRGYSVGTFFHLDNSSSSVNSLVAPYVFDYPVLEMFPSIVKTLVENTNDEEPHIFNSDETEATLEILRRYKEVSGKVKQRTLNKLNIKKD